MFPGAGDGEGGASGDPFAEIRGNSAEVGQPSRKHAPLKSTRSRSVPAHPQRVCRVAAAV